ncbi:MAG: hypothetical protein ACRDFR_03215, partial [Candidatus Limnocylindria bacterium]
DGQEEVRRLHAHAQTGLEVIDPQAAALLSAEADSSSEPAPAATNATRPKTRRRTPGPSRGESDTPGVEAPLRPAKQVS